MSAWLEKWEPENENFWETTGKKIAWKTLSITTFSLMLSFATWFMMSGIVVKLPGIGFKFTDMELFWLAAMPGLAGGTLRIIHMFLIPIYGTRNVISIATLIKIIPVIGLGLAITNPDTPFWVFMTIALTAGFGGGDFSSYMPSTSTFFPKRLQGTALGIQAGIGNFGVSLTQFVTPWIINLAALGAITGGAQVFTKLDPQTKAILSQKDLFLQNASYIYLPFLFIIGVWGFISLKSVPVKASFREQFDIFKNKHTWFCTATYVMTFGAFAGLSAAFPMLIKTVYGKFPEAPDPLKYAFYGPLIGSASRVAFGFVADKVGGAILTHITGIAMFLGICALIFTGSLTPTSVDQFGLFVQIMLFLFFFTGVGNAATFRQYPIIFGHSPRQAAGVIGWTAAIAAYGPFVFSISIGSAIKATGNANVFFYALLAYVFAATYINWWYYTRKGCEKPS